jgi:hypothetical protein
MRCDDVFELLTSGIFPSGAVTDAAVERHLESCHECRRFAEALRPNCDSEGGSELPLYQGRFAQAEYKAELVDLADRVQTIILREKAEGERNARVNRQPRLWALAPWAAACCAACLVGAAAALGGPIWARGWSDIGPRQESTASAPIQAAFAGASCKGEAVPRLKNGAVLPVSLRESKDACCLTCHGGGPSQQSHRKTIGLVVLSCQKCHEEKSQWARL